MSLGLVVLEEKLFMRTRTSQSDDISLGPYSGSTLRLVGSGLKFCKEDLNMAAINFPPLQNLKWL